MGSWIVNTPQMHHIFKPDYARTPLLNDNDATLTIFKKIKKGNVLFSASAIHFDESKGSRKGWMSQCGHQQWEILFSRSIFDPHI